MVLKLEGLRAGVGRGARERTGEVAGEIKGVEAGRERIEGRRVCRVG